MLQEGIQSNGQVTSFSVDGSGRSMPCLRRRPAARARMHYNAARPHSSLGHLIPNEFVASVILRSN